jgi:eukaryotic-like serine/threonine-protein kinase
VRLALFAEMVKGRPWLPATLRELGGMDGVGLKFLEDTFSSTRANPKHHYHQKAAQAVLQLLLPETNSDIKGRIRSMEELRAVSGYADRQADFIDLIRVLDTDLRLITPVDPEGAVDLEPSVVPAGGSSYQLTHDYLVHSLRDWLTRKRRQTRRGRAELRLATITSFWRDRPERRRLPSPLEWIDILCYTKPRFWSDPERRMMRSATQHYAVRGLAALAVLVILSIAIIDHSGRIRAESLISQLLVADTSELSAIFKETDGSLGRTRRALDRIARDPRRSPKERLHASLALLPFDETHDDEVFQSLIESEPDELIVLGQRLRARAAPFVHRLWTVATDPGTESKRKLRAACALAILDPHDARWDGLARDVSNSLVLKEYAFHLKRWLDALRPIKRALLEPVAAIFRDRAKSDDERFQATVILEQFGADLPEFLVKLIMDADLRQYSILLPVLKPHRDRVVDLLVGELHGQPSAAESENTLNELASEKANCAVTLLLFGEPRNVWSLLGDSREPRVRGFLLERIEPMGVDPKMLIDRLREERDTAVRRALVVVLADYSANGLPTAEKAALEHELLDMFLADPDAGIHSAAESLLRRHGRADQLDALLERLKGGEPGAGCRWYINRAGDTMVIIDPRGKDPGLSCRRPVDRVFAMASKEVSVRQFLRFRPNADYEHTHSPTVDCPINCVNWYTAAAYCRWLSERERLPEEEMCYPPINEIKEGMRLPPDYLRRIGYRLPTEAEAEYACRAGTVTSRFFGSADLLLPRYDYFRHNSQNHSWPVGSLRPNDLGLFDILGNVLEWCQESRSPHDRPEDREDTDAVSNTTDRFLHSGSYDKVIDLVRSDRSEHALPPVQFNSIGFRVARTVRPRP